MLKEFASMEKFEDRAKVEAQMSTWDLRSISTSACLPAGVNHWVFA